MASRRKTLYIGVTNNIQRRVREHQQGLYRKSFSKQYQCHTLVYVERYRSITVAIQREKQLKKWRRQKKIVLIEKQNPFWKEYII